MSDENSFGSVATQEAPPAAPPAEKAEGRSTRAVLLVAGVAAVVLAVFAYLLFFKGGSVDETSGLVPAAAPAAPAASTAADPADKAPTKVPEPKDVTGRNPFDPLEVQSTTGTPTGDTAGTPPTGTTTPPVVPAAETVTLSLVTVSGDVVKTTVGSTTYKGLAAGDTFATNFQVYAIFNGTCAGFLYGDASINLCEGKSVTLDKL